MSTILTKFLNTEYGPKKHLKVENIVLLEKLLGMNIHQFEELSSLNG